MEKHEKKVTVSLTEEDYAILQKMAEKARRHINQMASMMIEDAVIAKRYHNADA